MTDFKIRYKNTVVKLSISNNYKQLQREIMSKNPWLIDNKFNLRYLDEDKTWVDVSNQEDIDVMIEFCKKKKQAKKKYQIRVFDQDDEGKRMEFITQFNAQDQADQNDSNDSICGSGGKFSLHRGNNLRYKQVPKLQKEFLYIDELKVDGLTEPIEDPKKKRKLILPPRKKQIQTNVNPHSQKQAQKTNNEQNLAKLKADQISNDINIDNAKKQAENQNQLNLPKNNKKSGKNRSPDKIKKVVKPPPQKIEVKFQKNPDDSQPDELLNQSSSQKSHKSQKIKINKKEEPQIQKEGKIQIKPNVKTQQSNQIKVLKIIQDNQNIIKQPIIPEQNTPKIQQKVIQTKKQNQLSQQLGKKQDSSIINQSKKHENKKNIDITSQDDEDDIKSLQDNIQQQTGNGNEEIINQDSQSDPPPDSQDDSIPQLPEAQVEPLMPVQEYQQLSNSSSSQDQIQVENRVEIQQPQVEQYNSQEEQIDPSSEQQKKQQIQQPKVQQYHSQEQQNNEKVLQPQVEQPQVQQYHSQDENDHEHDQQIQIIEDQNVQEDNLKSKDIQSKIKVEKVQQKGEEIIIQLSSQEKRPENQDQQIIQKRQQSSSNSFINLDKTNSQNLIIYDQHQNIQQQQQIFNQDESSQGQIPQSSDNDQEQQQISSSFKVNTIVQQNSALDPKQIKILSQQHSKIQILEKDDTSNIIIDSSKPSSSNNQHNNRQNHVDLLDKIQKIQERLAKLQKQKEENAEQNQKMFKKYSNKMGMMLCNGCSQPTKFLTKKFIQGYNLNIFFCQQCDDKIDIVVKLPNTC